MAAETEMHEEAGEEKTLLNNTEETKVDNVVAITDNENQQKMQEQKHKYMIPPKERVTLYWKDIKLDIKIKPKKKKNDKHVESKSESDEIPKTVQILKGVSGCAKPGELYVIIGASGGGKTTLLSILTGRIRSVSSLSSNSIVCGHVQLNNITVDCSNDSELNYLLKNIKFVMQQDVLYATEKCKEVIQTSAQLRLKGHTSQERNNLVAFLLDVLDINKCADTFIGSEEIRGLSGGERTRTSIGIEIVTNPKLIILDEPTSGLDSASAYATMSLLKNLADLGRTVIACIHQPSPKILAVIDKLLVLAKGKVVYEGPADMQLNKYLESVNYKCPAHSNVTDYFIQNLNENPQYFIDAWNKFEDDNNIPNIHRQPSSASQVAENIKPVKMVGYCTQFYVLFIRFFAIFRRDSGTTWARLIKDIGQALIMGIIWYRLPLVEDLNPDEQEILTNMNDRMGGIFMATAFIVFNCLSAACIAFPSERLIFEKERSGRWYYSSTYLLSKYLLEMPWDAVLVLVFVLITYWMVNFNMIFGDYFGGLLLITLCCDSFAFFLSTFASNAKRGSQIMPLITNFLILFSGMFISIETIPKWLRWLRFINPLFYGLQFMAIAEFEDVQNNGIDVGNDFLERMGYEIDNKYFNLLILTILLVGVRLLAFGVVMIKHGW
eukprot:252004_1